MHSNLNILFCLRRRLPILPLPEVHLGADPEAGEEQEDLVQEAVELGAEYVAVECVADLNLHKPDTAHPAEDNY